MHREGVQNQEEITHGLQTWEERQLKKFTAHLFLFVPKTIGNLL